MGGRGIVTSFKDYAESIINTVREPLIALDQDLRVVSVSRSFYAVFKVNPEETLGQLIYDLGNKQWDIPKLRELLETILPEKTSFDNYEVEHDFTTIGRRIMLLNARQIEQALGKERIILLAIEDITERRHMEDLLAESEMRYRRIFETANDGIVLLEKSAGTIVQANQAVEKMLGYSETDVTGKKLQDIGIPLDMDDFPLIMQSLDKNGILNYEDVMVKSKSGEDVTTDIYMVDRAKLVQCNIRDVSERKLAEAVLDAEKRFIEYALNTLKDVFFVSDLEGRLLRWNKAIREVTGYLDTEIDVMQVQEFFRNGDAERITEAMQATIKAGSTSVEALFVNKDGQGISYDFNVTLLSDAHGQPRGFSGVGRDITERNKLEAQLLHSQKMEAVGTLAGGIAHDFNNLLNVIMGYGSMVMEKMEDNGPSKKHMNEVLVAADMAANLTKRLLLFSRKQVVEMKPANINDLILGLKQMLLRVIRENIDLNLNLAESPLILQADNGQIEQVLINLAANAKDVMPEGGRLTISTRLDVLNDEYAAAYGCGKPGKYVLITVADTGQGMDAEIQKRIFEPFFTTKGVGKGTGLGLAISYGIIKQHGGNIIVYSEPGRGTEFKIYLPLSEKVVSSGIKTEDAPFVKGGSETILVAEDNSSLMQLSRIILESFGYKVITAKDGEDAIEKFMNNKERISLLLLDLIMPKKNGKEVFELIHNISPGMKVIFTSGYSMETLATDSLTTAGFDYINKPFKSSDLLTKVREVLDR